MLCSWLNCYSWHPKPVVAQDSTSEAHVPECSLRMAARISCGLVLLVGVQALVQPPAKTEQVQVLGCGTFQPPNSTRCQDGKCYYRCVHPDSNRTELVCKEQEFLHMVGISARGISWACQDLISCPVKPTLVGCNCTVRKTCVWYCASGSSLNLPCHAASLSYLGPGLILQCAEGKGPETLGGNVTNWVC
ncbi:cid13 [Symbiodinium microadriaticum]|nr:cid13 [Symbiodinium microadriaticum]